MIHLISLSTYVARKHVGIVWSECLILIHKYLRSTYVPNTISGSGVNTEISIASLCLYGA